MHDPGRTLCRCFICRGIRRNYMVSFVEYLSTVEILSELRQLDIHVSVEGDRLRCSAPPGRLTKELARYLAKHKAEIIEALCIPKTSSSIPRRSERNKPIPLSFAQERLWFQQNLKPESTALNITATRRFPIAVNGALMKRAIDALAQRHEILRTCIAETDGVFAQDVRESLSPSVEIYDMARFAGAEQAAAVESTIRKFAERQFSFTNESLFRVALLRLSSNDCQVVMTGHHIACDGWSLGIFFAELCSLYEAESQSCWLPS
jgi:hypothetical protein